MDDRARAGRALLSLEAESRLHHPRSGFVKICIRVHYDRVLTAHFSHHTLDPKLARLGLRRAFVNAEADLFRAGEGNKPRQGMVHDDVTNLGARSGHEV